MLGLKTKIVCSIFRVASVIYVDNFDKLITKLTLIWLTIHFSVIFKEKVAYAYSRAGVPNLGCMYPQGYICLSEGVHLRLSTEEQNIFAYNFFSKYLHIYQLLLFSKMIIRLLLNISMNNHDKIYCHRKS